MEICKAVFLFPLTKSLRVQKDRLLAETGKYSVEETEDPLDAGRILASSRGGILYCSDTKKLMKCLAKHNKLFNDSKFRIIVVLPKRIVGKELVELNKSGVQDILVEPLTEKSLTTKVEYNYQMIRKLLEALAKKPKNKAKREKMIPENAEKIKKN